VEKVKLSDGERQIVSGLAEHYLPEELVGKKVVILKNLATAKLRGVESQGMLLAADGHEMSPPKDGKFETEKGVLEAIFCPDSAIGDKILRKGEKSAPKGTLTINEFRKIRIDVRDFVVVSEGKPLIAGAAELRMKDVKEGEVC
jgi:tRNA-binding EMAP/Myf-like protein